MADVESARLGEIAMIALRGSLDITNLDSLKSEVTAIEESRVKKVVVDLHGLRQIDSSGVGVRERVAPLLGIELDLPPAPGTCPDVAENA